MALDTSNPQPAGQPAEPSATGTAGWQYVRDLPTPPEVTTLIEAKCRGRGWWWRWWHRRLLDPATEDLKLQYHYGGKIVAVMNTDRGLVVIAAGDDFDSPALANLRERLPPEVYQRTALEYLPPWNDDTTYV